MDRQQTQLPMLSPEFHNFVNTWRTKANSYGDAKLEDLFDKFFTLFVIYNRLYAEATFVLARQGGIAITQRTSFPDAKAAKTYVIQFLTANRYVDGLDADPACQDALNTIIQLLDNGAFSIKLDLIHGTPQRGLDLDLLRELRSNNAGARGHAVLDVLYSMRCNMFHGHKGFSPTQAALLNPAIILLMRTVDMLFNALNAHP